MEGSVKERDKRRTQSGGERGRKELGALLRILIGQDETRESRRYVDYIDLEKKQTNKQNQGRDNVGWWDCDILHITRCGYVFEA